MQFGASHPSKSPRPEYDLTVLAPDGPIVLLHRATGQRHHKLTVFTASKKDWETILTALYEDHLKKRRDLSQNSAEAAPSIAPAPVAPRKSP